MAFSDWQIICEAGYVSHTPTLNSSLSSPLTGSGAYCRRLSCNRSGDVYAIYGFNLTPSFSGGAFYGIPNSKAVRIQSNIRLQTSPNDASRNGIFLTCKSPSSIDPGAAWPPISGNAFNSYCMGIKSAGGGICKKLLILNGNEFDLGNTTYGTWHSFRLEVYPIGSAMDVIKCFEEITPGNWTQLTSINVSNTSPNYINWDSNRENGFFVYQQTAYSGEVAGYIDNFNVSVANAPTPIP